ncbi:arsenite methyltransferase [Candidatus Formimonas warabiya]|uniref:Arsenite methyltransferase n=1 Tax=Formimonas warabiya TaxID=1761012 RepID=A0A3G1KMC2_FORW1|nr:arsenite methyltransferase [Candidatus Formimonas warabiya]ATW23611.1 arsenite S-adenosylmethyltransferase [Candidatus Formimonas warabiya]
MDFNVKETVKEKYGNIAKNVTGVKKSSCCSSPCCGEDISAGLYDMETIKNLPQEAVNASLGCANPLLFAGLKEGEIVLDLGSGGGIDVFLASKYVGDAGKVYGLDMTDEMLELANRNKETAGITNVSFLKGYIEEIPLPDESVDVIMSNCVINLSENKEKALSEAYRVLKKGGRLAIADIVTLKDIPSEAKKNAEMWVGCLAGALNANEYKKLLSTVGFEEIKVDPIHVYTKEIILDLAKPFGFDTKSIGLDAIDGAFAGAAIKARK